MRRTFYAIMGVFYLLIVVCVDFDMAAAKARPVLNKKSVTLAVGKKITLKVKNAKKKVRWSSSNKNVATVSAKGVVKAKKGGKVRITAKVGNSRLTCRVTVVVKNRKSGVSSGNTSEGSTNRVTTYQKSVQKLVNKERASEGLGGLALDESLCEAAMIRAKELVSEFSHTRPDGSTCFTVMKELGIKYHAAGENIAAGQSTPESAMDGWMNSPGHRANILSEEFHRIGVGYAEADDGYGYYWVQLFSD